MEELVSVPSIGPAAGPSLSPPQRCTQRDRVASALSLSACERAWDTRAGTVGLKIPKLRSGSYFPGFLEPRRTAEKALAAVIQEAYV